jgi:hypothetical protein
VLAHFAEPQGGKACVAGLKTRDESRGVREFKEFKEFKEFREFSECYSP